MAEPLGILLISGGHERAHYAFVLAAGAAAMGRRVCVFATNAGCHALLRDWSGPENAMQDAGRDAAVREAELVLLDTVVPRMSPEAFEAFEAAISRPPVVSPRMLEVLTRRAPWEREDAEEA